ncbi:putative uncharacterized protein DDB_G0282133 isoform X2 [Galleria mellonella]|uniref:Protein slender lobes n=1 Tax=Galleria mellonella TaxID=7137 RepID=A0ABM3MGB2_GALME|nr:putative uncharacterized protein DDB_G0282133 isoform X2 [Galleria mellonella]
MEEDATVKAPVTPLRRRLSIEQTEDTRSPSTPLTTPTKKRGGRLATKPQLDLIDENASDNTPKKGTKKATVKDIEEEKPLTPSRRSARIKSNTSLILDTPQAQDSPRAKRAARRTSQIGSDSETLTPARQTRKTRKDSSSSIDKQDAVLTGKTTAITEPIVEETETNDKNANTYKGGTEKNKPIRASPRTKSKAEQNGPNNNVNSETNNTSHEVERKQNSHLKKLNDLPIDKEPVVILNSLILQKNSTEDTAKLPNHKNSVETNEDFHTVNKFGESSIDNNFQISLVNKDKSKTLNNDNSQVSSTLTNKNDNEKLKLSESNANLINKLDHKPKNVPGMNKSTSNIADSNNVKNKRYRTKSWTNLSSTSLTQNPIDFNSDNEIIKKNKKTKNSYNIHNMSENIDSLGNNILNKYKEENDTNKSDILNSSSSKKIKRITELSVSKDKELTVRSTITTISNEENSTVGKVEYFNNENNKNNLSNSQNNKSTDTNVLEKGPVSVIQSIVYFEDSDTDSKGKSIKNQLSDNEDQCVPVINNNFVINNSLKSPAIDITGRKTDQSLKIATENPGFSTSCEPMDIDETIPSNTSIIDDSNQMVINDKDTNSNKEQQTSQENKSLNIPKKTSMSPSKSLNLEKTHNETKSTLILSQLKDESSSENSVAKSPICHINEIMSKSFNNVEGKDNKNAKKKNSLDYSTSTPLQQKTLKKLTMQINTSEINDSNTEVKQTNSYNEGKHTTSAESNKSKNLDIAQDNSNSEEESYSEEESIPQKESSKESTSILDDEAEEASDDYESGDSRDDDERQYEKENEILEKGETLDSEDEVTDDSDYEKDSFVVSTDEDDNELLDGSGDDLSMSDNELTMSKKSKKKYNERKNKEQKLASREMFEARHNISKSEKLKSKPKNRQRLDSSNIDSDEEVIAVSKNHKRNRLHSTQELETDKLQITKDRQLSDSVLNVSANKETEISLQDNENIFSIEDPLSMQVKSEPKTPQKELEITTVPIADDIEEIDVNDNLSIRNTSNESSDPLQNEKLDENDSLSENEEIVENYDSVLKDLNNINSKKIKMVDTSLDSNVKSNKKCKSNEPIIDQLNLTQTKKCKKDRKKSISNIENSKETKKTEDNRKSNKPAVGDDDSSDSIDLHLLFSEDSMDSVNKNTEDKNKKDFIPLKKSEGNTNIPNENNQENIEELPIFVDTIGARGDTDLSGNMSLNTSKSKKNKKDKYQAVDNEIEAQYTNNDTSNLENNEMSINISLNTSKKKKKKHNKSSNSESEPVEENNQENIEELPIFVDTIGARGDTDLSGNMSLNTSKSKKNKKGKHQTVDNEIEAQYTSNLENNEMSINISLNTSKKKKKKHNKSSNSESEPVEAIENMSKVLNSTAPHESLNISSEASVKKKNKKKHKTSTLNTSQQVPVEEDILVAPEAPCNTTLNTSTKKKKNKKKQNTSATDDTITPQNTVQDAQINDDAPTEVPFQSHKNAQSHNDVETAVNNKGTFKEDTLNMKHDKSLTKANLNSSLGSKKKGKLKADAVPEMTEDIITLSGNAEEVEILKKRKRKLSASTNPDEDTEKDDLKRLDASEVSNEPLVKNQIKKRKLYHVEDGNNEKEKSQKKGNKKRKERDDDEENTTSKIFKNNSFEKVSVPRLPSALLSQLDDKPKKEILDIKKSKIISTTQFKVEDVRKRRNKPSNYLEESVYLNDANEKKKQKGNIKIPKVLPFVPTVSTSGNGFTTNFQISVIPKETKFIAQTENIPSFKREYLYNKKIKRLGTYELYKRQRNMKISKF